MAVFSIKLDVYIRGDSSRVFLVSKYLKDFNVLQVWVLNCSLGFLQY